MTVHRIRPWPFARWYELVWDDEAGTARMTTISRAAAPWDRSEDGPLPATIDVDEAFRDQWPNHMLQLGPGQPPVTLRGRGWWVELQDPAHDPQDFVRLLWPELAAVPRGEVVGGSLRGVRPTPIRTLSDSVLEMA